ncbi:MAG TPA: type II toxin-antitoxin system VapC family toxin [Planctomycetota bacterium]|jgi:hypothetical protein
MAEEIQRPSAYLETTIPSYLAAEPSRDLVIAAHQQITHQWWNHRARQYELFVSDFVRAEVMAGDPQLAARRLDLIARVPTLAENPEVRNLAKVYEQRLGLTGKGLADIAHLAFAVEYEVDYLLTWNCAHIANGEVIRKLLEVNGELRRETPVILTPEALLESL